MKELKLKLSAHLYEFKDGEHDCFDSHISGENHIRVIDGELRSKLTHEELKQIISKELKAGEEWLNKKLLDKLTLPLTKTVQSQIDEIESDLLKLIPNWRLSVYMRDGIFRIYNIHLISYSGETIDIYHPLNPNQYVTTKYTGMRDKLSDGTWTYGYQCLSCYEGIIERVEAPFDESILVDYFKSKNLKYELSIHPILPLPEACFETEEDSYDD